MVLLLPNYSRVLGPGSEGLLVRAQADVMCPCCPHAGPQTSQENDLQATWGLLAVRVYPPPPQLAPVPPFTSWVRGLQFTDLQAHPVDCIPSEASSLPEVSTAQQTKVSFPKGLWNSAK